MHERNRQLFEHYVRYVGMLDRRVFSEIKLIKALELPPQRGTPAGARFEFVGSTATLTCKEFDWILVYRGGDISNSNPVNSLPSLCLKMKTNIA